MLLKKQLEQTKTGFIAKVPIQAQEKVFQHIKEQQLSGIAFGLKEGDTAPDFTLSNPFNEQVTLYDELAKGPVVLTFYRGGWCPFCNIQLKAYQQVLPEIRKVGGQLIAISPQSPDHSLSQKEKDELTFQVLSDPNGHAADSYNILFELPDYLQNTFKNIFKLDLAEFNKSDRWILPVPATFIIGKDGIIRCAHVKPDFMERMEPQEIINQLKNL